MGVVNTLVIGASGLVGSYLYQQAQAENDTVWGTYFSKPQPHLVQADVQNTAQIAQLLQKLQPSTVYFPAANPHVDWIESNSEEAFAVNVAAPKRLVDLLVGSPAKLVYYSTDYVFDGTNGPYHETDTPRPLNVYGEHKLAMEQYIAEKLPSALVLRTAWVYGWEATGKNFAQRLLENLRNGNISGEKPAAIPHDQQGNPSYAPHIAQASRALVQANQCGLFHVTGQRLCSRYAFACAVAEAFGLSRENIAPVATSGLNQKATRPLQAGMQTDKLQAAIGQSLPSYHEALQAMRNDEADFWAQAEANR